MVVYTPPNQPQQGNSNSKIIGGAIIMILGIITFFCAVFVPIMLDNIFLMFPFFFGGFIVIIIGAITLTIGLRDRSMATGNFQGSRMMRRYMGWTKRIFGNKNQVNNTQNPNVRYDQVYNSNEVKKRKEIICSYCGSSNSPEREFCIRCGSKLDI